jgi:hypothetical protein
MGAGGAAVSDRVPIRSPESPRALVALPQGLLPSEMFGPTRLVLPANLPYEAWDAIGNLLAHMHGALQWWWSDWILAGLDAHGEEAPSAQALTDRQYGTIANWIYVGRMFEPSRRREKLTWGHHYEVARFKLPGHTKTAPLPDVKLQDKWLDLAEQHEWSVRQLREQIVAAHGRRPWDLQDALVRLDAAVRAVAKRWPEGEEAHEALGRRLCALGEQALSGGDLGA